MPLRVHFQGDSGRETARARNVVHTYKGRGEHLYIEEIPPNDPGGKNEFRIDANDLIEIEGSLTVYPYEGISGSMKGNSLYINSAGDWELMTVGGPEPVPGTWKNVR